MNTDATSTDDSDVDTLVFRRSEIPTIPPEDVEDEEDLRDTIPGELRTPTAPQSFRAAPLSGEWHKALALVEREDMMRQEFRAAQPTMDEE